MLGNSTRSVCALFDLLQTEGLFFEYLSIGMFKSPPPQQYPSPQPSPPSSSEAFEPNNYSSFSAIDSDDLSHISESDNTDVSEATVQLGRPPVSGDVKTTVHPHSASQRRPHIMLRTSTCQTLVRRSNPTRTPRPHHRHPGPPFALVLIMS